jgi:hypothetical protein
MEEHCVVENNPNLDFGDERSEKGALSAVRNALGAIYSERTGQDSTKADGFIRFSDGSEIELEVFRSVISKFRQATSELERIKNPVQLAPGSGTWIALLPTDTNFKEFTKLSDDVFQMSVAAASTRSNHRSPVTEIEIAGFTGILLMHMSGDENILDFGVTTAAKINSGFISTHPNSVANFVQKEILDRSEKIQRLIERASSAGREAHMAVVIEETENTGMQFALMGIGAHRDVKLPEIDIQLPDGLAGFWVISGDHKIALGYLHTLGWTRYEEVAR